MMTAKKATEMTNKAVLRGCRNCISRSTLRRLDDKVRCRAEQGYANGSLTVEEHEGKAVKTYLEALGYSVDTYQIVDKARGNLAIIQISWPSLK